MSPAQCLLLGCGGEDGCKHQKRWRNAYCSSSGGSGVFGKTLYGGGHKGVKGPSSAKNIRVESSVQHVEATAGVCGGACALHAGCNNTEQPPEQKMQEETKPQTPQTNSSQSSLNTIIQIGIWCRRDSERPLPICWFVSHESKTHEASLTTEVLSGTTQNPQWDSVSLPKDSNYLNQPKGTHK